MVTDQDLRTQVSKMLRGKSVREMSEDVGLARATFHQWLSGRSPCTPTVWRALYRRFPELRWLLEEYQRQRALNSEEAGDATLCRRA